MSLLGPRPGLWAVPIDCDGRRKERIMGSDGSEPASAMPPRPEILRASPSHLLQGLLQTAFVIRLRQGFFGGDQIRLHQLG